MDISASPANEIKFVSISRVNDAALLLGCASDKTKKAYAEEVTFSPFPNLKTNKYIVQEGSAGYCK
jgi:hypothetical protein